MDLLVISVFNHIRTYFDEDSGFRSLNPEMEQSIQRDTILINAILEDAQEKQLAHKFRAFDTWIPEVKDAIYQLDDILDDFSTETIRDEIEGKLDCVCYGNLHPRKVYFRRSMIERIKEIRKKTETIVSYSSRFNLAVGGHFRDGPNNAIRRQRSYFYNEDQIYGREEDKENIIRLLLKDANSTDSVYMCPIVAMGGMGKTALAQLVYNDRRVREHFELKIWICVSGNFDLKRLIEVIIESPQSHNDYMDNMIMKLRERLEGKRYLLVLDDVWDKDPQNWFDLKMILPYGAEGSSILVTTREEKVALLMSETTIQPYRLAALPRKACWEIIKKCAFKFEVQETDNFVKIGKKIAAKCKGVPLVARKLGWMLRRAEPDERLWISIRDKDLWDLLGKDDYLNDALILSYSSLPRELRRCFSYCAVFPNGYMIEKEEFIHLLMANGFISSKEATSDVEDVGDAIVNELYEKSLIQDVKRDESGKIYCFKLHDLFHGLVRSIMDDECSVAEEERQRLPPTIRHLSIDYVSESIGASYLLENVGSLRTLIYLSYVHSSTLFESDLLMHTSLRALNLSMVVELRELPSSICVLKHLRYLNLSDTEIRELPESLWSLWNLQILNLNRCTSLKALPKFVVRLINLRHLCMRDCWNLSSMPRNMSRLTSLRTLSCVIIGDDEKLDFQLYELGCLNYLRGKLEIVHLERVRDVKHALEANLRAKQDLEELSLIWGKRDEGRLNSGDDDNEDRDDDNDEENDQDCDPQQQNQIFEALRPAPRIRYLEVTGYKGLSFPDWIVNGLQSFQSMKSVRLSDLGNCSKLPPLWRLPSLKSLRLESLDSVRCLIEAGEEDFTFKSLETLKISSLPRLERITSRDEANQETSNNIFPCLSNLAISKCPRLSYFTLYPLPSLRSYCVDNKAVLPSLGISTSNSTRRTSSFSARRR